MSVMLAVQITEERAFRRRQVAAATAAAPDQTLETGDAVLVTAENEEHVPKRRRLDHDLQVAMAIAQDDQAIYQTNSRPIPRSGNSRCLIAAREEEHDHAAQVSIVSRQGQMFTLKDLGLSSLEIPQHKAKGCTTLIKVDPNSELFAKLTEAETGKMSASGMSGIDILPNARFEMQSNEGVKEANGIWRFERKHTDLCPSLLKRNFFVVQKHQATALHYDLRMQVDGGTFSWAIPKGFIGLGEARETQHQAIETTVHGIDYSTVEGPDGHTLASGVKCGTMVWDIGEYEIGRRHDREGSPDEEDSLGVHEERQLANALDKTKTRGHRRTIYFTLKRGRKLLDHSFILKETNTQYKSDGTAKISWMLMLQKGTKPLPRLTDIDLSILSGRSLEDICSDTAPPRVAHEDGI